MCRAGAAARTAAERMSETLTYLKLYYGGGYVLADPSEESRIDAAVSSYLNSGRSRDELLSVTLMDGLELRVLASHIDSWYVSTPETRRRSSEIEKALDDENKAVRAELGIFEA